MLSFLLVESSTVTLTIEINLLRSEEKREKKIWKVTFIETGFWQVVLHAQRIFTICYIEELVDAVLELKRVVDS